MSPRIALAALALALVVASAAAVVSTLFNDRWGIEQKRERGRERGRLECNCMLSFSFHLSPTLHSRLGFSAMMIPENVLILPLACRCGKMESSVGSQSWKPCPSHVAPLPLSLSLSLFACLSPSARFVLSLSNSSSRHIPHYTAFRFFILNRLADRSTPLFLITTTRSPPTCYSTSHASCPTTRRRRWMTTSTSLTITTIGFS
jgi:hypothetical protein